MGIYFFTFIIGLYVDQLCPRKYRFCRIIYILWLFVFLCFSYTNGSDWRSYELGYDEGYLSYVLLGRDLGFVAIMNAFRLVFSDFWLSLGILKCLYLISCIKVLKKYTDHWIMALVLMLPLSLLYMIIDNPLRFMVAMTFVNFAMLCLIDAKYIATIVLSLIALSCHTASLFCIILLPFIKLDIFSKYKSFTLLLIYLILLVLSSSLENILHLQNFLSGIMEHYFDRDGLSDYYEAENVASLFTAGTIINFVLFYLVLRYRNLIVKINKYLFSTTILYFYVYNISHVIPVGHRIRMALTFYCCISYTIIMLQNKKYKLILASLFCLMLMKNIWVTYSYIPYTNSIPHIVTSHKPYAERSELNLINYKERTGKEHLVE